MHMDEIGYNHRHDRSFVIDRPSGAGDWLLLIIKAPAFFRIDGKMIRAAANSFIIYTPEYPQYYYPDSDEYYDDWIHFYPEKEELDLMQSLNIPFNCPVPLPDTTEVSVMARNMCYEQYSANQNRKQSVDLYFRLMIYKLHEKMHMQNAASKISESVYFTTLLWVRQCIYRWPGRDWSIDDMAKELSLSRSRFQHLYSDTFGVSVNKDLITSRLEKAKELLICTDLGVNDIATIIGYNGVSYFLRQFKSAFGITPIQYRNAQKNDTTQKKPKNT